MGRREYQNPSVLTRKSKFGPEYYIRYRIKVLKVIDGQAQRVPREKMEALGLCSETTLRQAERKKAAIMKVVNGQVYTVQSEIPFCEFVALYKERYLPSLRATTQKNYGVMLRRSIEPYFAGKKLCDIRPEHVHQFIMQLDLAPLTRKTVRGLLLSIWNLAITWGYWKEQNPVKLAFLTHRLPDTRKRPTRIWTPEELQKILMSVRPDVRLMIETLIWTGMRISECLGLRWRNVDLDGAQIRIVERQSRGDVDVPKSKRSNRTLPLGALVAKYQEIRGEPDSLVFSDGGAPYSDCALLVNYLDPILRSLGLKTPGCGWHSFRRTHLTWFSENGGTVFETQAQAGHSSIDATMLYILPDLSRRRKVVESMQADFEKLCGTDSGKVTVQ